MLKKINRGILVIISLALFVRLLSFVFLPILIDPDSPSYIEHIQNIYDGKGFSVKDYTDNTIKPTAYRMPLFQYSVYFVLKILKLDKDRILSGIKILNAVSSLFTLLFVFFISYLITENLRISIVSFLLTFLNINLFYNSMLALTDTFFSFTVGLFILTTILAIKYKKNYLFFISGLTLGFSILTRPITKFYPVVMVLFLFYIFEKTKKSIQISVVFLIGVILVTFPWIMRNYQKLGLLGFETNQGLNMLWSFSSLVEITKVDDTRPIIKRIKEIIIEDRKECPWPMGAEIKARKELKLSEVESSRYFQRIGIETILTHPFSFLKIFLRNLLNNITSATSEIKMIDIFLKRGYYDVQHKIMIRFENIEKSEKKDITFKEFLIILPNIIFRFIHLVSFIIAMIGAYLFIKRYKEYGIFLLSLVWYCLILTSIVGSYDRYRVPFEIILNFFISYVFIKFYSRYYEKHT